MPSFLDGSVLSVLYVLYITVATVCAALSAQDATDPPGGGRWLMQGLQPFEGAQFDLITHI